MLDWKRNKRPRQRRSSKSRDGEPAVAKSTKRGESLESDGREREEYDHRESIFPCGGRNRGDREINERIAGINGGLGTVKRNWPERGVVSEIGKGQPKEERPLRGRSLVKLGRGDWPLMEKKGEARLARQGKKSK